ncbi:hypothetical protein E0765_05315 [Sulfuricurvum sp. IAE1]|uniref:hypothetical protein n=1 Tax=Sulfuricurvum sp. IAE1 TaxID=2546102 RepID=UPI00104419B3|nr:hypothetical protein [Sulfuricurvum sp. IAE1]MDX9966397.1 hypothetical protein [Sulfuricurvum sp.]TDA64129.1 hypothetical protein E0765_05315 [Sulfuricurvum sp. IAE1]
MSLKENMDALKEELNSEEKFLESAIKTERFIKRYQKPLIAGVVSLLFAATGAIAYQAYTEAKIESSNAALNTLLLNPGDKSAEATLKNDNPALYDLWKLSRGIAQNDPLILSSLKNSEAFGVADIASYEAAIIKSDAAGLENYTKRQGALYKDLALLELAVHALEQGNTALAHQKISQIGEESPIYQLGQSLSHYGVK